MHENVLFNFSSAIQHSLHSRVNKHILNNETVLTDEQTYSSNLIRKCDTIALWENMLHIRNAIHFTLSLLHK